MMAEEITPDEIRSIRRALGLTQVEAGAILGGGPRAFAKYEAGTIKPSSGLIKLLRLLESNPSALASITDTPRNPNPTLVDSPFTISGRDIMRLREWDLPQLLRLLLHAEAEANGLPADDIHVAEEYWVADGGEDAHIRWKGDPDRTAHLPGRYTQFQIKCGAVTPAKARNEVLTKDGQIKPLIHDVLEAGGFYVLLCTSSFTEKKTQRITDSILDSLQAHGCPISPTRIRVQDADQLAIWINHYPTLVTTLKELSSPNSTGPFRSFEQWIKQKDHVLSPFVQDARLPALRSRLVDHLSQPGEVVRILGASGIGKSRLVLESLKSTDVRGLPLSLFVLYADEYEVEQTAIFGAVRVLADTAARAIIVADNCAPDTHQRLVGMVTAPNSRLSLVSIDNTEQNSASAHDHTAVHVGLAPQEVTQTIIDRELPSLHSEDRRRLLLFSLGYPTIAIRVASAWTENKPIPYSTDQFFVDRFVTGGNDPESVLTLKVAQLIAAFGTVRHTPLSSQAPNLASLGRSITAGDMQAALNRLLGRGVVRQRGGVVVLQPRPVAMQLTERQWLEWTPEQRMAVLGGDMDPDLKCNAAGQLRWLNSTQIAHDVVQLMFRKHGPFDGIDRLSQPGNVRVLYQLAVVDEQLVVDYIRRTFDDVCDLRTIDGDVRRYLVETLERTAFPTATFEESAWLLLRLATAETEPGIANNATGQFAGLFPMYEGATSAHGDSRIAFLRDALKAKDSTQRHVLVEALLAGAKTMFFSRIVGAETHGSRPALEPWRPENNEEALNYVTFFAQTLAHEAMSNDEAGIAARAGLGHEFRRLVSVGLIDVVENIVDKVRRANGSWSEAIESLGNSIEFDAEQYDKKTMVRVRVLLESLQPTTLQDRIRDLVSNMPWDYPNGEDLDYEQQARRQIETIHAIAHDALAQTPMLAAQLPNLCCGTQRWATVFGQYIGERIDSPDVWLRRIEEAICSTPDNDRNFELLAGFVTGLSQRTPDAVETIKRHLSRTPELAPALPAICSRLGLIETDIQLVIDALRAGNIAPVSLMHWSIGGVLSKLPAESLATLVDELRDHSTEGLTVAIELVGMFSHGAQHRLEHLRPQLVGLAESLALQNLPRQSAMVAHHARTIFTWLLRQGRDNGDARTLALALARALTADKSSHFSMDLLSQLLPDLLSNFPEISWPMIGQHILNPTSSGWRLRYLICNGSPLYRRRDSKSPLLSLPHDALFAWCEANPEKAPSCAAQIIPVLTSPTSGEDLPKLHPIVLRLLDEFGDREDVLRGLDTNIHSFTWMGSITSYFSQFLHPLSALFTHPVPRVARWAKRMHRRLKNEIVQAKDHDDEYDARFEI